MDSNAGSACTSLEGLNSSQCEGPLPQDLHVLYAIHSPRAEYNNNLEQNRLIAVETEKQKQEEEIGLFTNIPEIPKGLVLGLRALSHGGSSDILQPVP